MAESTHKHIRLNNNTARNVAVNAQLAFERDGCYIQNTLDSIFSQEELPQRERGLASELAYGTCRNLIILDYLISRHSKRPLRQIDKILLQIIRVGIYQLVYLMVMFW